VAGGVEGREGDRRRLVHDVTTASVGRDAALGLIAPPSLRSDRSQEELEEAGMASRNLARDGSREHEKAKARLEGARESRDAIEGRRVAADTSGEGELEASVALSAAEEQLAARQAWVKWVERDY
jgi:hypothetical protein